MKVQSEAAGADKEMAVSHPKNLVEVMNEGGYTQPQISSVVETALHLKKIPVRTSIARKEKTVPGFKASKNMLTIRGSYSW